MVTVRKSKLLTPTSVIPENTYYYEFDCDTIAELPTATYQGTNVAHGSLATIIANGRQYRINGESEWCIQRYDASDPILIEKTITENGTYTALDDDVDGYSSVIANVPNTYTESDEGKVVDNGELVAQTARAESITANGTYDTTNNNSVTVDVPGVQFSNVPTSFSITGNIQLEHVDIPQGCTEILTSGFANMTALKSVSFPNTVTIISPNAFQVTGIEEMIIPNGVTSLGNWSFYRCSFLRKVVIPNSVTSIGTSAFNACPSLSDVTIGTGVTDLPNNLFGECTGLTSIEIPSNITSISSTSNRETFYGCTNLQTITINKPEGSISGAPWGATNATVVWTG